MKNIKIQNDGKCGACGKTFSPSPPALKKTLLPIFDYAAVFHDDEFFTQKIRRMILDAFKNPGLN